jgi:hypothetical protein
MNLDIVSIKMEPAAAGPSKSAGPTSSENSFLSMLGKVQSKGMEKMMVNQPRRIQAQANETTADFQTCLSALRSGLLAKGKPLGQVRVSRSDAHLLNTFLGHCGYSREAGSQLIDGLLAASPDGEIVMSRFLAAVRAAGAPRKNGADDIILDVSTVPYLESLLNGFGLSGDEIGSALNSGRSANGGLDLEKLIRRLKSVGQQALQESRGVVNLNTSPQMAETLKSLGIDLTGGSSNGRITILDVVNSLKQVVESAQAIHPEHGSQAGIHLNVDDLKNLPLGVSRHAAQQAAMERGTMMGGTSGRPGEQADVPADLSNAISRIIEKATRSDQTDEGLTAIIKNSKIKFDDPASKKINADDSIEENKLSADASKEKLTAAKGEGKLSAVSSAEEIKPVINHGSEPGFDNAIDPKTPLGKSLANAPDMPLDSAHTKATASAHGFERTPQPTESSLPNHVIDQLGRQISRSLIRGDGIVQLRLKPSELGTVRLEMQMTDNRMHVTVAAENGTVKELLMGNVQELKEMLQAQGIRLEKLDVNVGGDFSRTFSNLNEGHHNGNSHKDRGAEGSFRDNGDAGGTRPELRNWMRTDAMVDLVA